jgi:hypothetical protein
MRAEVAAVGGDASGMTRYLAMTLGLEAVGTSLAALLPITSQGSVSADWLGIAFAAYGLSLLPTVLVANGSMVGVRRVAESGPKPDNRRLFAAGAVLMAIGSGPTLLFVALAAQMHGREAVAGAAIAFAVGSLLSPRMTRWLERGGFRGLDSWPLWCAGMIAGWAAAPWSLEGLWFAQLLSGLCLTGFQGVMDHALAGEARDGRATTTLAQGSAARALGSAVAVRLVPLVVAPGALAGFAAVSAAAGALAAVGLTTTWSSWAIQRRRVPVDASPDVQLSV